MNSERAILNKLRENIYINEGSNPLLIDAVCAASCFSNDMKHIHLHASGKDFEQIHTLCQGYYDKASEDVDTLAEIALEYVDCIPNLSYAVNICGWETVDGCTFTPDNTYDIIMCKIDCYISVLTNMYNNGNITDDIKSVLDEIIRFWRKESNYKINRKLNCDYDSVCAVDVTNDII